MQSAKCSPGGINTSPRHSETQTCLVIVSAHGRNGWLQLLQCMHKVLGRRAILRAGSEAAVNQCCHLCRTILRHPAPHTVHSDCRSTNKFLETVRTRLQASGKRLSKLSSRALRQSLSFGCYRAIASSSPPPLSLSAISDVENMVVAAAEQPARMSTPL